MNRVTLEDTVFVLNMRIRMIRDTLHLSPPAELFLEKTMDDLRFTDGVLETFARDLTDNKNGSYHTDDIDFISDTEWQFNQLLTEFALNAGSFSTVTFPEIQDKIAVLRVNSDIRRRVFDETCVPAEMIRSEPVLSSAEFNGLLGSI